MAIREQRYRLGQTGYYINGESRYATSGRDYWAEEDIFNPNDTPLKLEQRLYAPNTFDYYGAAPKPPPKYGYYALASGTAGSAYRNSPGPDAQTNLDHTLWTFSNNFGYDVDIASGYAIVGDPDATYNNYTNCGAAVLYRLSGREYYSGDNAGDGYSCQAILPGGGGSLIQEHNYNIEPTSGYNAGIRVACGYGRAVVIAEGSLNNTYGPYGRMYIYDYSGKLVNVVDGNQIASHTGTNDNGYYFSHTHESYNTDNFTWDIDNLHHFGMGVAIGDGIIAVTGMLIESNAAPGASRGILFIFDMDGYELSRTVVPDTHYGVTNGFGGHRLNDTNIVGRGCSRISIGDGKIIVGDDKHSDDSVNGSIQGTVFAFDTNGNYLGRLATGQVNGGTDSGTSGNDHYIGSTVSVGCGQITIHRCPSTSASGGYEQIFQHFTSDFEYAENSSGNSIGYDLLLTSAASTNFLDTVHTTGNQGVDRFRPAAGSHSSASSHHETCLVRSGYKILRTVQSVQSGQAQPIFRFTKLDENGAEIQTRDWKMGTAPGLADNSINGRYGYTNNTDMEGVGRKMAYANGRLIMSGPIATTPNDKFVNVFHFPMATHSKSMFDDVMR